MITATYLRVTTIIIDQKIRLKTPRIAAGAAVVLLTIAYGIGERARAPQVAAAVVETLPGEPLKLKLEFAFPAARR